MKILDGGLSVEFLKFCLNTGNRAKPRNSEVKKAKILKLWGAPSRGAAAAYRQGKDATRYYGPNPAKFQMGHTAAEGQKARAASHRLTLGIMGMAALDAARCRNHVT